MKKIIMPVKGNYKVCGVIGSPIAHTLSPLIHNQIAASLNQENIYVPFHVMSEDLKKAIEGAHALGVSGLNITMPHKQHVMTYVTELDQSAEQVGAVNTLVYTENGYVGYNTDVYGLKMALKKANFDYRGEKVAIIGSGGAAYAAAVAVSEAKSVHIYNRTLENAQHLKKQILNFFPNMDIKIYALTDEILETYQLVVQTTGVGMGSLQGSQPVCSEALLERATYAFDMIYNPSQTLFLKTACQKGCQTSNGFDMLFYQAIKAYELIHKTSISEKLVLTIRQSIKEVLSGS
ncbi:MAG: shikimate dehydrogenase [Cellulosilyticaceae bacterium]